MNVLEYEMIDLLKELKEKYGVFEIKAEYENEGSRQTELMRLKDIAEKINLPRITGLLLSLIGVLTIISKGNIYLLLNFKFTTGDLWMVGASAGWAIYSVYLLNWKSNFSLMGRFTLIAFFGAVSLFPFLYNLKVLPLYGF